MMQARERSDTKATPVSSHRIDFSFSSLDMESPFLFWGAVFRAACRREIVAAQEALFFVKEPPRCSF